MIRQDLPISQEKGPGIHTWLVLFTVCVNNIIGLMDINMITISIPELTIQAFMKAKEMYYEMMGWPNDSPSPGKLGELGLDWAVPMLHK